MGVLETLPWAAERDTNLSLLRPSDSFLGQIVIEICMKMSNFMIGSEDYILVWILEAIIKSQYTIM